MSENDSRFTKYDLNFLIKLKTREFRTQDIHNISEKQIKDYLFNVKWKNKTSLPMCTLVDDIVGLEFSELFDYLSVQVVKEASQLNIDAFQDLISK